MLCSPLCIWIVTERSFQHNIGVLFPPKTNLLLAEEFKFSVRGNQSESLRETQANTNITAAAPDSQSLNLIVELNLPQLTLAKFNSIPPEQPSTKHREIHQEPQSSARTGKKYPKPSRTAATGGNQTTKCQVFALSLKSLFFSVHFFFPLPVLSQTLPPKQMVENIVKHF